jgi:hypothetical protein
VLRTDSYRPKRDRRTAKMLFHQLQAQGFPGGYGRVAELFAAGVQAAMWLQPSPRSCRCSFRRATL